MAFICKLLGCGSEKDPVKQQQQQPATTRQISTTTRQSPSASFEKPDAAGALSRMPPGRRVVSLDDSDDSSCDAASPTTKSPRRPRVEEKSECYDDGAAAQMVLPPPPEGAPPRTPKKQQSPALPKAWQLLAHIQATTPQKEEETSDETERAAAKDVDLEVMCRQDEEVFDAQGEDVTEEQHDDDDETERGSFGVAWRAFKQQEDAGFGALREYVSKNYVLLLRKMLSPARERYATMALGPECFDFRGRRLRRDDFAATNERGLDLQCSLWRDRAESPSSKRSKRRRSCVVYVHDVGGSRLGSLSSLGVALDAGAHGFCAFDCTACGRSDGAHVTFGHFERYDIAAVVAHLSKEAGFTDFVLWGRGAGAVAAVRYAVGLEDPAAEKSYFEAQSDALYDSVFGGETSSSSSSSKAKTAPAVMAQHPRTPTNGHTQARPAARVTNSGGGKKKKSTWTYAEKRKVSVDLFQNRRELSEKERVAAANKFAASLELVVETSLWVVSKPALVVGSCTSAAARLGVKEGDVLCGLGTSMKLPHSYDEFREQLAALATKPDRSQLEVHFLREKMTLDKAARARLEPYVKPAALILDCVVDSPAALVAALRDQAAQREPILVSLLEPLLQSGMDVLFHSVKKRANFDPNLMSLKALAPHVTDVPALFGANDFSDVDRGIPRLYDLSATVFEAFGESADEPSKNNFSFLSGTNTNHAHASSPSTTTNGRGSKTLVKYNAPLRLALRGTLDAMSSKFLNKTFVFLQTLPGIKDHADRARANFPADDDAPPRWVVTTRPWAQKESKETIDDYESAQIGIDSLSPKKTASS